MQTSDEWKKHISTLEKETVPVSKEKLKEAILKAIIERIPKEKFGVFFSGGVDSTLIALICKQQEADFYCYTVGVETSTDVHAARQLAKELDLPLKVKIYTLEELEELFKRTAAMLPQPDVLSVGVGSVVVAAAELAKEDKVTTFFSGIGTEEIFAGYERHLLAEDKHAECWRGLRDMWDRDFIRDFAIGKAMNLKVLSPFLDDTVIKTAMGIDISRKISDEYKKIIFREIAEELGVPKEFAWRKKKAAQYGSRFDHAMAKLAKQKGFGKKKAFIDQLR